MLRRGNKKAIDAIARGELPAESLDDALDTEITPNRVRRGPRYVHTPAQRDALCAALVALITARDSAGQV
ncbi:MAG: hypothetical protein ACI802_003577 [Candidatus Paceibacteria bacterium]|jgi:hypothetical protein